MSFYKPIPISVLIFAFSSLVFSFFSPEFLFALVETKVNRLVLLNSDYPGLKLSLFSGAVFSSIIMIPYLICLSLKTYDGDRFTSKGHLYSSFVGFLLFVIYGLNSFVFFGAESYFGQGVVENPFVYFIFCVAPIILYQIPFRYFA